MSQGFESGLNQHGHAFHYRVIHEILTIADEPHSRAHWELVAVEVPVSGSERSTRIDFLLQDARPQWGTLRILVAEVKRVNPAFGRWCFAKAPYSLPVWTRNQVVTEQLVNLDRRAERWTSAGIGGAERGDLYQIGFALKTEKKGDSHPVASDRDAIESACTQVLRGLNGLVTGLLHDERLRSYIDDCNFVELMPVVFTTAQLFVTSVDLSLADLETGEISLDGEVNGSDWLLYQYPQSPDIKHHFDRGTLSRDSFADLMARDFVRSVAIVGPGGIREFLRWKWMHTIQA